MNANEKQKLELQFQAAVKQNRATEGRERTKGDGVSVCAHSHRHLSAHSEPH